MKTIESVLANLKSGGLAQRLSEIYGCPQDATASYALRLQELVETFAQVFADDSESTALADLELFSAPGRTEIGGNHTDHQHGHVLAASVNLDVIAAARKNGTRTIRIQSEGFPIDVIDLDDLTVQDAEKNTSAALIRGVAARFAQLGYPVAGFDAYTSSNVLKGSGLSSSAAFEVLVGNILNTLFASGEVSPVAIAQIGQYAENVYYGKPCGLMDQMASSVGGIIAIDFGDPALPVVEPVSFDFAHSGLALCIIDSGADHGDLTDEYAAIPAEMKAVAACFGKNHLREVPETDFLRTLAEVRGKTGDRAVLRALHFFADDQRVALQASALKANDVERFKSLIIESGRSSSDNLQNVFATGSTREQSVALVLALCERLLAPVGGAWRVHGGGFAGTVQAFVPLAEVDAFKPAIEAVFGLGSCHVLSIRPVGGCWIG
ncbi:MAG: galactokinase family protein [Eubacteriales bacterium]|nr:galactokinase family protein [Eubacteriales bacterium]